MTRVLLTGANGFIAREYSSPFIHSFIRLSDTGQVHILELLLKRGSVSSQTWVLTWNVHSFRRYSVRGTVRTQDKADKIATVYTEYKERLDFIIVEDISTPGAFDQAVISEPPFDYILHTASPLTLKFTDVKSQVVDPAIRGTLEILKSAKNYAPTVKRVVSTKLPPR